jgi:hypothetical protein
MQTESHDNSITFFPSTKHTFFLISSFSSLKSLSSFLRLLIAASFSARSSRGCTGEASGFALPEVFYSKNNLVTHIIKGYGENSRYTVKCDSKTN